jgi:hypothetical protein
MKNEILNMKTFVLEKDGKIFCSIPILSIYGLRDLVNGQLPNDSVLLNETDMRLYLPDVNISYGDGEMGKVDISKFNKREIKMI